MSGINTRGRGLFSRGRGRGRVSAPLQTYSAPPDMEIDHTPSPTPIEPTPLHPLHAPSTQGSSAAASTAAACGSTDSKMLIRPNGKEFIPSTATVGVISSVMKTKYEQPWTGWKDIPQEVRDLWWVEFQKYCRWDPQHDVAIRRIWGAKCADTVRANLASIRARKSKGKWLSKDVLDALWVKWRTDPEFKDKSERNKKNRSASEGGCLNRGGSISVSEHKRRYTRELGREATIPEVFHKLNHNDETNQWSTPRAAMTYSSFEKLKEDVAGSGSSVDDSALFFQATGGKNKRGRAYGFGSEVAFYSSSGSGSQSATTAPNSDDLTQMQQRIAVLETQLEEQQRTHGDQVAQLEAELNTQRSELQSQRQSYLRVSQLESELATLKEYFEQFTGSMHYRPNNSEAAPTMSLRPPTINEDDEDDENLGDDSPDV